MTKIAKYLSKWSSISFHAKIEILHAALVLVLVKTGLSILSFSTFRRLFQWISRSTTTQELTSSQIDQTVWAVNTAANVLPLSLLCLPRALATKYLLKEVPSLNLEIGIEVNPDKVFEAHAWVEKEGKIIIGDWSESVSYQRLWIWK